MYPELLSLGDPCTPTARTLADMLSQDPPIPSADQCHVTCQGIFRDDMLLLSSYGSQLDFLTLKGPQLEDLQ